MHSPSLTRDVKQRECRHCHGKKFLIRDGKKLPCPACTEGKGLARK